MHYSLYDFQRAMLKPLAGLLATGRNATPTRLNPLPEAPLGRLPHAVLDSAYRLVKEYPKQDWAYSDIEAKGETRPIHMTVLSRKPFCQLLRFRREGLPGNAPKVLFVAALSGHYATLSKETFAEFLPDHDVYVTDWINARDVPLADGRFGFDEYVAYLIEFLQTIGRNVHLVGLCQAAVPALVAACVMADQSSEFRPRSLTLMGGPIDISVNPNAFYRRAKWMRLNWVRALAIRTVPAQYAGAGRRVYAGAQQLLGFLSLNPRLHIQKHVDYFRHVLHGDVPAAEKHRVFYDEYFSMMDATEEFYLETLQRVFIEQQLPQGRMRYQGELVRGEAIKDIPILTVEGREDNMVMVGQTQAAHTMCPQLPEQDKQVLVQDGVGHYGIFSGEIFRREIAPRLKGFFRQYRGARS